LFLLSLAPYICIGNVFEPRALNELIPDWKEKGAPLDTPVTDDAFLIMTSDQKSIRLPNALLPPQQVKKIKKKAPE
jgi:electron-transferring-flavoprotein dehydrogenase